MPRRFTLAGLLLWTTFAGIALAFVVPLWRHINRRRSQVDRVASVAASADGSTFAALLGDGRVLVWDSAGQVKTRLQTQAIVEGDLSLSCDGKLLAVWGGDLQATSSRGIEVWNVSTRKCQRTIRPASGALRFSPTDDSFMFVGRPEVSVLRSLTDTRPIGGLEGACAAFSPDGKRIAVGKLGVIQPSDLATWRWGRALVSDSGPIASHPRIAWAPDGRTIAAASLHYRHDSTAATIHSSAVPVMAIELWDLAQGGVHRVALPDEAVPTSGMFNALAYLPDSRRLLVAIDGAGSSVLDCETLQWTALTDAADYAQFATGLQGETLLAATDDSIDLLDASTLEPRQRLFDAASPPSPLPVLCGFFLWCIAFAFHRARQRRFVGPRSTAEGGCAALT